MEARLTGSSRIMDEMLDPKSVRIEGAARRLSPAPTFNTPKSEKDVAVENGQDPDTERRGSKDIQQNKTSHH